MSSALFTAGSATLIVLLILGAIALVVVRLHRKKRGYGYSLATRTAQPQSASDGPTDRELGEAATMAAEEAEAAEEEEMRLALGVGAYGERRMVLRE